MILHSMHIKGKHHWYIAFYLFVITLLLYSVNAARLPVNYADSDDLTLAAKFSGLAHPPGYLLLTKIAGFIMFLLPTVEPAAIGHLTSSVIQSGVVVLLFFSIKLLLNSYSKMSDGVITTTAFWTCLLWSLQPQMWTNGTIFEIFPMASLLVLGWALSFHQLYIKNHQRIWIVISSLFAGLAISFHQLTIVPIIIVWVWSFFHIPKRAVKNQIILHISLALFIILLAGGTIDSQDSNLMDYSWPTGNGLLDGFRYMLRLSYTATGSQIETYVRTIDIPHSLRSLRLFLQMLMKDWGLVTSLLMVVGTIKLLFHKHSHRLLIGSIVLLTGPFLIMYLKLPLLGHVSDEELFIGTALRLRQFYLFHLISAAILSLGIAEMYKQVLKRYSNKIWIVSLILISASALSLYLRVTPTTARDANFIHLYGQDIVTSLPPKAILIVDSDVVFTLLYQQLIHNLNPELTIIPARFPLIINSKEAPLDYAKSDSRQDLNLSLFVASSIKKGSRIFMYAPDSKVLNILGVEGNPFYAYPHGYVLEITSTPHEQILTYDYGVTAGIIQDQVLRRTDYWYQGLLSHISTQHIQLMYYYARQGFIDAAQKHRDLSQILAQSEAQHTSADQVFDIATARYKSQNSYTQYKSLTGAEYWSQAETAFANGQTESGQYFASRALMMEPSNQDYLKQVESFTALD